MNEIIRQLAEQSFDIIKDNRGRVEYSADSYGIEKFVELIVQECADYFGREGDHRFEVDGNWIAKTIKQHFGVDK